MNKNILMVILVLSGLGIRWTPAVAAAAGAQPRIADMFKPILDDLIRETTLKSFGYHVLARDAQKTYWFRPNYANDNIAYCTYAKELETLSDQHAKADADRRARVECQIDQYLVQILDRSKVLERYCNILTPEETCQLKNHLQQQYNEVATRAKRLGLPPLKRTDADAVNNCAAGKQDDNDSKAKPPVGPLAGNTNSPKKSFFANNRNYIAGVAITAAVAGTAYFYGYRIKAWVADKWSKLAAHKKYAVKAPRK